MAEADARQRVAPMAAGALGAAGEAHPDRAHQAILVEVQNDAGAGAARSGQRAPPEQGMQVVRVHHAGAAEAHRAHHFIDAEILEMDSNCWPRAEGDSTW